MFIILHFKTNVEKLLLFIKSNQRSDWQLCKLPLLYILGGEFLIL